VLISRLRGVIDRLIERRVENPTSTSTGLLNLQGSDDDIIRLVTRLVELDGLDA
jgi:ATP-dependent RNA helicase DHX57